LKNLNIFSNVLKATEYEIERQKSLVSRDIPVTKETKTYDNKSNQTISIRTKEDQYDYRFMPVPNLLSLVVFPSQSFTPTENLKCLNNPDLIFGQKYA
jgi:aspartyl-tRNA(Asn)/glutamyl-tRNA(Gln) amidotransferase subunit B